MFQFKFTLWNFLEFFQCLRECIILFFLYLKIAWSSHLNHFPLLWMLLKRRLILFYFVNNMSSLRLSFALFSFGYKPWESHMRTSFSLITIPPDCSWIGIIIKVFFINFFFFLFFLLLVLRHKPDLSKNRIGPFHFTFTILIIFHLLANVLTNTV